MRLSLERIRQSISRISMEFLNTPQYECEPLGRALGCHLTLKVETLNSIRCFKGRGTDLAVSRLAENKTSEGAVCASVGNLGQALAYCGRARGISTMVIAPENANPIKLNRMRDLGAELRLVKGDFEYARVVARQMAENGGFKLIEDSQNLDTCEGAGTIGLELLRNPQPFDALLIALGGGALATGVGHVFKSLAPQVKIICVQPAGAPAATQSWHARKVVESKTIDTIADGVAGRCPIPEVMEDLYLTADDAVLVREDSIIRGMKCIHQHAGLVVEPSAALGVAAMLEDPERFRNKRVATILCGSNVDTVKFQDWIMNEDC